MRATIRLADGSLVEGELVAPQLSVNLNAAAACAPLVLGSTVVILNGKWQPTPKLPPPAAACACVPTPSPSWGDG